MSDAILKFLADILTDRIDNVKETALELYTDLRIEAVKVETKPSPVTLIIPIPYTNKLLHIPPTAFLEARGLAKEGKKIQAIKVIRFSSSVDGDPLSRPGLKEAKDFVEIILPLSCYPDNPPA